MTSNLVTQVSTVPLSSLELGATFRRPRGKVIYQKCYLGCASGGMDEEDRSRSVVLEGRDKGKLFPIAPDAAVVPVFTVLQVVK